MSERQEEKKDQVIKEQLVTAADRFGEPPVLTTGTIIVRSTLLFNTGRKEIASIPSRRTDRNTYIFKITWDDGLFTSNWHTIYRNFTDDGMICFCEDRITDNIIAFGVKGLSKSKKACFVSPIFGNKDKLISTYYNFPAVNNITIAS